MNELEISAKQVKEAKCPEDIFGSLAGTIDEQLKELAVVYRRLAIMLHEDKYTNEADKTLARGAFVKVTANKVEAERKIKNGSYGDRRVADAPTAMPVDPVVISTRRHKYKVEKLIAPGEIADVYLCTEQKASEQVVLKLARSHRDNDLMQNEANLLRKIYPASAKDENYYRYHLKLQDSFMLRSSKGSQRRVNVLPVIEGYFTLEQIMQTYQDGLDYRDMAWMFKRLLAGIGFAHQEGIIHGALNPTHVMVHPTKHGAKIIDWCYGIADPKKNAYIRVMSEKYSDYCAPEIKTKGCPTPATDIYSAAACMVALLGGNPATGAMPESVPKNVRNFISSCMLIAPARRPDNAWDLHEDFDKTLRKLVGRPKYRPLTMPETSV